MRMKNSIANRIENRSKLTLPVGFARLRIALWPCLGFLLACNNNYQAPVTEAGERQVIVPPEIVSSAGGDASRPSRSTSTTIRVGAAGSESSGINRGIDRATSAIATPAVRNGSVHRVRPGESLFSIAFQYDLDFRSLAIANNLQPPYTIFVDQELQLDVSDINSARTARAANNPAVTDTGVVRTRAGGGSGGVMRQPIGSQSAPNWQWPLAGRVLRGFAVEGNEGIDIDGRSGDPVLAAGDGDVVYSGRGVQGVGNLIIIRHNDRYLSAYGHNSVMLVNEGQHVQAGQQIAEVGNNATGVSMLHFEIREEGKSIDPRIMLP